jgi:hypothetical protein
VQTYLIDTMAPTAILPDATFASNLTTSVLPTTTYATTGGTFVDVGIGPTMAVYRTQPERMARWARAREVADILLVEHLDDEQRESWETRREFSVAAPSGCRYLITGNGVQGNVYSADAPDGRSWRFCIHPDLGFPLEDALLTQKLLIETDEDEFLRVANASRA